MGFFNNSGDFSTKSADDTRVISATRPVEFFPQYTGHSNTGDVLYLWLLSVLRIKAIGLSFDKQNAKNVLTMEIKIQDRVKEKGNSHLIGVVLDRFIQNIELDEDAQIQTIEASEENPAYLIEFPGGQTKVLNHGDLSTNG